MTGEGDYLIRLAVREDAPGALAIYRPFVEGTAVTFETETPGIEAFGDRIEGVNAEAPWLVCTKGRDVAGYAYAGRHRVREAYRCSRELSVYVDAEHRNRGIASGLYTSLIRLLYLQGYCNALAGITLPNISSVKFHESMGFKYVGTYHKVGFKLGQYHDVGWWELFLRQPGHVPSEPMGTRELVDSREGLNALQSGMEVIDSWPYRKR
ncbi:MAG: N-acetyltransferase [Candidatus Methanofastidiosa archaeon]|nr:N-acetyltransferase [Candidatus Methanofastidiosa archaeon]